MEIYLIDTCFSLFRTACISGALIAGTVYLLALGAKSALSLFKIF